MQMCQTKMSSAFQTCAYDSGAVMITKLESFETSLQQIESIMGKSKFTEVRKSSLSYTLTRSMVYKILH